MKIIAKRIFPFPILLAFSFCIIAIGAPLEKRGEISAEGVIFAFFSLVIGFGIAYATLQNQIIIENGIIEFRKVFSRSRCDIAEIEIVDLLYNGRFHQLFITSKGRTESHNLSQFKYTEAVSVLKLLFEANPFIEQKMGVRDSIRFKPRYWWYSALSATGDIETHSQRLHMLIRHRIASPRAKRKTRQFIALPNA